MIATKHITDKFFFVSDCFYKQNELSFALEDYDQALELDPQDTAIKTRISAIHNEFGANFLQDKNYAVSPVFLSTLLSDSLDHLSF